MQMNGLKILVTGANGFVGRSLCSALVQGGYSVREAVRTSEVVREGRAKCSDSDGQERKITFVGNVGPKTDWSSALSSIDVVVHLAARVHVMKDRASDPLTEFRSVNVLGTEHLARSAAACGVKRLVYVSSIKVNGEATCDDQKYTEQDMADPQDPYGISKWEAEQVLHQVASETGLEVVVVRPPLVYGPGVKGNFAQMLEVLARGYPLPLAAVANRRSLVYVDSLVDALIACATQPAAAGQTYLVSDGEDISTPDLLRRLAAAMGRPTRLFPFPVALLKLAGRLAGKSEQIERLLGSLQVDSAKIRRDLNWVPPYTLQQGLRATAEWYRNQYT